jgi:peroxiredoxin
MNTKRAAIAFLLLFSVSLVEGSALDRVYALLDEGRHKQALAVADSLIQREGQTRPNMQARVTVLDAMGLYEQALQDALLIEKMNVRKTPWDCITVAETYLKLLKPEEALRWLILSVDRKFMSYETLSDSLYDPVRNTEQFASVLETIRKNIGIGLPAKNIRAACVDGTSFDLSAQKGKVLIVDFFATWCSPCREEMPNLKTLYDRFKDQGLEILGISLDQDRTRLQEYKVKENLTWKIVFSGNEWNDEHALSYGINFIPSIWVIDRQGILRGFDVRGEELTKQVIQLLAER